MKNLKYEPRIVRSISRCYCTECYPMTVVIGSPEPNRDNLCLKKATGLCSAHQVPVKGCGICEGANFKGKILVP